MEYYSAIKKNEIVTFARKWKMDGTGAHHDLRQTKLKRPHSSLSCSFVEPRPKMMMMMMTMMAIIMGHECIWGTV
jgi:hypothetical protein